MAMSKRIREARKLVDANKLHGLNEALLLLKNYCENFKVKFDETVEVVLKLGVDPRHSDQMVRGAVPMPYGLGRNIKVAVFLKAERFKEAEDAGADFYGAEDLINKIKEGNVNFDICIATPDMMPKVAVLGKILGTKGLMPNPRLGTVSDDIAAVVKQVKSGQVEYKVEKAGLVHCGVGKLSFAADALRANIMALYNAVLNAKPSGARGIYMQKMFLCTTHGPSIKLDLRNLVG